MLHAELLERLDALGPQGADRELSRWRALYALEHEERERQARMSGRKR